MAWGSGGTPRGGSRPPDYTAAPPASLRALGQSFPADGALVEVALLQWFSSSSRSRGPSVPGPPAGRWDLGPGRSWTAAQGRRCWLLRQVP